MTREEAINNLKRAGECLDMTYANEQEKEELEAINMGIEALEQESKTGHWIKYGIPRCGEQHYKCTSCEYYINFGQWGEVYTKQFKYCPNCGARMESEV